MAYIDDPYKKQQEDQTQNQGLANSGGNIYSTSQSEVSTVSNGSSGSNSSNTESNKSGNWVNLNKYLDANQGKVGGYVDQLVQPYTSKEAGYKENLDSGKQNYISSIQSDTAFNTGSDKSSSIANNYIGNSKNVSDNDKNIFYQTTLGYQGDDEYQNTGNNYGYNSSKNQADEFINVGSNLGNDIYLQSLMGSNVSSGGKNLNSFLVRGTNTGRQAVSDYSNLFSDLANLLDYQTNELNNERANVIDTATRNAESAKQNLDSARNKAKQQVTEAKNKAFTNNNAVINVGANKGSYIEKPNIVLKDNFWSGNMPSTSIRVNPRLLDTGKVDSFADKELREIDQRYNDLLGNTRSADSSLDLDMNSIINQDLHNKQISTINSVLTNTFVGISPSLTLFTGLRDQELKNAYNNLINSSPEIQQGITDLYYRKITPEELDSIIKNNITRDNLGLNK